jgi:hypothetical protein
MVSRQTGTQTVDVPFSSISGRVWSATVPRGPAGTAFPSSYYALYLSPFTSGRLDVRVTLDACLTTIPPALYICDPSSPAPCANPYRPSSGQNTASAATSPYGYRVVIDSPNVGASAIFVNVAAAPAVDNATGVADGMSLRGLQPASGVSAYALMLSAATSLYLSASIAPVSAQVSMIRSTDCTHSTNVTCRCLVRARHTSHGLLLPYPRRMALVHRYRR